MVLATDFLLFSVLFSDELEVEGGRQTQSQWEAKCRV